MDDTTNDTTTGATGAADAVAQVHHRALAGTEVRSRRVVTEGGGVHVLEQGSGPAMVLIHGTLSSGLFWLPVLTRLAGVRAIAPDRPGQGLSDRPRREPRTVEELRRAAVSWCDGLLDALGLESATLVGHSMGGLWALWFALARPERVDRLVVVGAPTLPGTSAPLPFRVLSTPLLGRVVSALPQTPTAVRRFASMVGEGGVIDDHPNVIDLLVACGRDPYFGRSGRSESRTIVSPVALVTRTGFRRAARFCERDLRGLRVPTTVVCGDHDPVGGAEVASRVGALVPGSRSVVVRGGHVPWFDDPDAVVDALGGGPGQARARPENA